MKRFLSFAQVLLAIITILFTRDFGYSQTTTVSVSPTTKNVLPARSFTLDVRIDNVVDLHGASVTLVFDSLVTRYISVASGPFMPGGMLMPALLIHSTTSSFDTLTVDQAIFLPGGVANGSGVLFVLTFNSDHVGITPMTVFATALRDGNNSPINCALGSGHVTVAYPSQTYVDPTYTSGSCGGHEFGFDGFANVVNGVDAVAATGTVNVNSATYNESVTVAKDMTLATTGAPSIQNLTLNTPSVVLSGNLQIAGLLNLTSGRMYLGGSTLTLSAAGSVSLTDPYVPAGFVVTDGGGSFARQGVGATDVVFPIGVKKLDGTTSYNPAQLNNAGAADNFAVRVKENWDHPVGDTSATVRRQWTIAEGTPGGSDVAVTLQWNNSTDITSVVTNPTIGHWQAGSWQLVDAVFSLPANPIVSATSSGLTAFSDFSVGERGAVPIQLASFTGTLQQDHTVLLAWTTLSEINNFGFFVFKRRANETEWREVPRSFVPGHGTTNVPQHYTFIDRTVENGSWYYRLKQVDTDNRVYYTDPIHVEVTSVKESAPAEFRLMQNYPNPFNPSTEIRFTVKQTSRATLDVYNAIGQKVATLFDDVAEAGYYHKVKLDGTNLTTGVYFYRLQSGKSSDLKKLILLK